MTRISDKFWREVEKDNKEIEKINKMIDRKEAKEMDNWLKRWAKEGFFWRKEKSKNKDNWL